MFNYNCGSNYVEMNGGITTISFLKPKKKSLIYLKN
jgi:hypothetical protein